MRVRKRDKFFFFFLFVYFVLFCLLGCVGEGKAGAVCQAIATYVYTT